MPVTVVELPARASLNEQSFVRHGFSCCKWRISRFHPQPARAAKTERGFAGSEITLVCASWNVEWRARPACRPDLAFDFSPASMQTARRDAGNFARFAALPLAPSTSPSISGTTPTQALLYRVDASARAGSSAAGEGLCAARPDAAARRVAARSDGRNIRCTPSCAWSCWPKRGRCVRRARPHPVTRLAKTARWPQPAFAILAVAPAIPSAAGRRRNSSNWAEADRDLQFRHRRGWRRAERDVVAGVVAGLPKERVSAGRSAVGGTHREGGAAALLVGLGSASRISRRRFAFPRSACSRACRRSTSGGRSARVVNLTARPRAPLRAEAHRGLSVRRDLLYSISPERVLAAAAELLRPARAALPPAARSQSAGRTGG